MLQIKVDKTGFPSVVIASLGLSVSWLPFTKIQLEHFIADTNNPSFDHSWYDEINRFNPRIAPEQMDIGKYEGVFVTGILPAEAKLIAQWMGNNYDLPTAQEWKAIFNYIHAFQEPLANLEERDGLSGRAKKVIARINMLTDQEIPQSLGDTQRITDQMLMRLGVMEYVYENNYRNSYAGQGQPNRNFHPNARNLPRDEHEVLAEKVRTSGIRLSQYGFRLIERIKNYD